MTSDGPARPETATEAPPPPPEPGPVARLLQQVMPGVEFAVRETPMDETVTISRDDFARVMETLKNEPSLQFDYLRCQSGADYLTELECIYHVYSFTHGHRLAVKVRCPYDDAHVPTVSHLWGAANWHERETAEMYGITFDGHPDLRPLLTEEGLGYYILRKSHPLAEIEEWQEDYVSALEKAKMAATAGPEGEGAPQMTKVEIAQAKAKLMKEARDKARAEGLSPEDEKAAVRAAIDKFEAEMAAGGGGGGAAPAPMTKVELAQAKAKVITKAREEARAKGMSTEDEKVFVAEALKKFSAEQEAGGAAAPAAAPKKQMTKVELAQAKAKLIVKAREEARAQGMSTEDEKKYVAEKLKEFSAELGD
ncbi:MAG TPA: NADH-quinone oxidoreductase subunit C [Dehalococcoidia bacterium]|nr:NADH-quinone oxidoreductase subunit C [Dehalococcoidia bacterium]